MRQVFQTMKDLFQDGYTTIKKHRLLLQVLQRRAAGVAGGYLDEGGRRGCRINYGMVPSVCYSPETCKSWTSSHNFVQFADENRTEKRTWPWRSSSTGWASIPRPGAKNAGMCPAHLSINDAPEFLDMPQAFLGRSRSRRRAGHLLLQVLGPVRHRFQPRGLGLRGRHHLHRRRARADRSGDQRRYHAQ